MVVLNRDINHPDHKQTAEKPFQEFVFPPQLALKKENLVVKKPRSNQPQRPAGRNIMVWIVIWVIDMGVMLHVYPRKHRESKTQHQGATVSQNSIHRAIAMGCIMRRIVNHSSRSEERFSRNAEPD